MTVNAVDYARIHYDVAVKVWRDSDRWLVLFPTYDQYTALQVEAESIKRGQPGIAAGIAAVVRDAVDAAMAASQQEPAR